MGLLRIWILSGISVGASRAREDFFRKFDALRED